MTVAGCTVSGNSGGGIVNNGTMTVSNCTLSGNLGVQGAGIVNNGKMTVSSCTLSANSAYFEGGGICNSGGTIIVTGCTLSGNFANGGAGRGYGGGIVNFRGTVTISGCTLSGNSAFSGGGIYNGAPGTLTIGKAGATDVYGVQSFDIHCAVYGNQAPSGTDLENLGTLSISDSAVASLDNQNPGATTVNLAATDTATGLIAGIDPSSGQIVFNVQVMAAQAGAGTPTGTVTLYDGNNDVLAIATLDANGQAIFPSPVFLGSQTPLHVIYSGDSNFTGSTSAPLSQVVDALTPANLQAMVTSLASSPTTPISLHADPTSVQDAVNAIENLTASSPVTVVLNLASGKYSGETLSVPYNMTLVINGTTTNSLPTTLDPNVPALVFTSGNLVVTNVTFAESGAASTILVTGGHLTLRNDIVRASTGYNEPAIEITGGTLDLGTATSPGGNTINVNGAGQLVQSVGMNVVSSLGNTFEINGTTVFPATMTALASSVNPSLLNQPVTFTAMVSPAQSGSQAPTGNVTFVDTTTGVTLGTAAVSGGKAQWTTTALPVNAQTVAAFYSGDANYMTSAATVVQQVHYRFSGFLAPLNSTMAIGLGRTVPIKFQLTDYNGAFISSLGAVQSLVVTGPSGTTSLTGSLRYDPTSNQFVVNWQTKGFLAGNYTVTLTLNDGTLPNAKTVALSKSDNSAGLTTVAAGGTSAAPGGLLGGDVTLYVDNANGDLTSDELARIQDAVTAVAVVTAPYGVAVTEISDPTLADFTLTMDTISAVGGFADGVIGCTTDAGQITIISGWNFYAGSDASQIGTSQYDFQTVVTHELGHALGLGHSSDSNSVMYATLDAGQVKRALATADLNVPDDGDPACGLHAVVIPVAGGTSPSLLPVAPAVWGWTGPPLNAGIGSLATAWPGTGDGLGLSVARTDGPGPGVAGSAVVSGASPSISGLTNVRSGGPGPWDPMLALEGLESDLGSLFGGQPEGTQSVRPADKAATLDGKDAEQGHVDRQGGWSWSWEDDALVGGRSGVTNEGGKDGGSLIWSARFEGGGVADPDELAAAMEAVFAGDEW
jgi:hypothetical protein